MRWTRVGLIIVGVSGALAGACGGDDDENAGSGGSSSGGGSGVSGNGGGSSGSSGAGGASGSAGNGGAAGSGGSPTSCASSPAPVPGASGKSIVVAFSGDDASGDGSAGKPYRSLKKACDLAQPGDAIELRGGSWLTAGETCSATGTAAQPVHVRPYPGESVVLDATGQPLGDTQAVLQLLSASYVVVDGLEIQSSSGRGAAYYESTGVTLRNLKVHDIQYRALGGGGQDIVIESNEVWNAAMSNENGTGTSGWPAAISTAARADGSASTNVVIRNNHVHDIWGECIIALFADGIRVEGNRLHDCHSVNLYVDNSRNIRVERNQIWVTTDKYNKVSSGLPATGITFATEGYTDNVPHPQIEGLVIANNVITGTGRGISYWHDPGNTAANNTWNDVKILHNVIRFTKIGAVVIDSVGSAPAASGGVLMNNVVWNGENGDALELADESAWQLGNNAWPDGKPAADTSASSLIGDPGMVAPSSAEAPEGFRLMEASPCQGKGAAAPEVTLDFWCAPRSPSAPSVGIHEP